jgi:predicted RNA-binding Zn-ribbon protein involved in translation (DUF1610 family)
MAWEKIAHYVERECGCQVDWDEEFFVCPECGEPIYRCDFQEEDYFMGRKFTGKAYCPVCEEVIMED